MLDKKEVLKGRESDIWFSGYAEGSKDAVRQMAGAATAYEEETPEEVNSQAYQKGYSAGVKYMYYNIMQKLYEEDKPLTLDEFAKQEELWESIGEPMTQEELDELHCVEEDFELDEVFDEGFNIGYDCGHDDGYSEGFDCGYKEAGLYNVILDGEVLDEIYDFKEQILGFRKEPWSENHEHNKMVFEIHRGLIDLAETWVMNQIWDYWYKRKEELENE